MIPKGTEFSNDVYIRQTCHLKYFVLSPLFSRNTNTRAVKPRPVELTR